MKDILFNRELARRKSRYFERLYNFWRLIFIHWYNFIVVLTIRSLTHVGTRVLIPKLSMCLLNSFHTKQMKSFAFSIKTSSKLIDRENNLCCIRILSTSLSWIFHINLISLGLHVELSIMAVVVYSLLMKLSFCDFLHLWNRQMDGVSDLSRSSWMPHSGSSHKKVIYSLVNSHRLSCNDSNPCNNFPQLVNRKRKK